MTPSKLAGGGLSLLLASLTPFFAWVTLASDDPWRGRAAAVTLALWGGAGVVIAFAGVWGLALRRRFRRIGADISGIWHSRYRYRPTGSREWRTSEHYLVLKRRGRRVRAKSRPVTEGSSVEMDLLMTADNVLTGHWREQTASEGIHEGAVYHGAVQLVVAGGGGGRRMSGKWVGVDSEYDVNTGPWELQKVADRTHVFARRRYNRVI